MDDICRRASGGDRGTKLVANQNRAISVMAARQWLAMNEENAGAASEIERRTVHYTGRVQGVGFRYTARSVAQEFDVAGFVRNLDDGRVQLVVEGLDEEIGRFLSRLAQQMGRYIRTTEVSRSKASGEFSAFGIER